MSWIFTDLKNAVDNAKDVEKQISIDREKKEHMDLEEAKAHLDSLKEQIKEDHKMLLYLYSNGFEEKFPKLYYTSASYKRKFICDGIKHQMGIYPKGHNLYEKMGIAGKFGFDDSGSGYDPCLVFDDGLYVYYSGDDSKNHLPFPPNKKQVINFCNKFEEFHKEFIEWLDKNLSQYRQEQKDKQVLSR